MGRRQDHLRGDGARFATEPSKVPSIAGAGPQKERRKPERRGSATARVRERAMATEDIDLLTANRIIAAAIAIARRENHLPLTFCVVDRGGHVISAQREDNSSTFRFEIAYGKAWTCIALGHSTNFVEKSMTKNRPHFVDSLAAASGGKFIPALGGVLVRDRETGKIVGAVGATGDTGENDEKVAIEAVEQCGFRADLS
jgi:uncharacterized protein GlcG (DUF336 family)